MSSPPPRRLAVVAYEMEGARTGVGRYLEGLLVALDALVRGGDAAWTFDLFFKGDPFDHPLWSTPGSPFQALFDRRPGAHPIVWEQLRLPGLLRGRAREHRPDLVFSPAYSLPPRLPAPGLVTIHDLSFERLPEEFGVKERWRRRLLARRAARRATRVLTDTRAVADEIAATYRVPRAKVGVVPIAIDPAPFDPRLADLDDDLSRLSKLGIEGRNVRVAPVSSSPGYALFLGSILPRRRLDLVIRAFAAAAARRPDLRLVLAGANRLPDPDALDRWISEAGIADRVVRPGYIDEDALPALYRRAALSFYLSTYEGYGLPPLESLAAGTPVVVSAGQALDDLWPDYPFRAALEPDAVVAATLAALEHGEIVDGPERVASLTAQHCAELFIDEVERALGGAEGGG